MIAKTNFWMPIGFSIPTSLSLSFATQINCLECSGKLHYTPLSLDIPWSLHRQYPGVSTGSDIASSLMASFDLSLDTGTSMWHMTQSLSMTSSFLHLSCIQNQNIMEDSYRWLNSTASLRCSLCSLYYVFCVMTPGNMSYLQKISP